MILDRLEMRNNANNKSKVTIETTFGRVTVFKDDLDMNKPGEGLDALKKEQKSSVTSEPNLPETNPTKAFETQNFFGIEEDSQPRIETRQVENNFFDQEFFGDFEKNSLNEKPENTRQENSGDKAQDTDDLNFIDSHYFSKDSNSDASKISTEGKLKNISKEEIQGDQHLNYFGKNYTTKYK